MKPYDNIESFFDPRPAAFPRGTANSVSRALRFLKWVGVSVLVLGLGACVLGVTGLDYLMWVSR